MVRQLRTASRAAHCRVDELSSGIIEYTIQEHFKVTKDDHQQVVEFVRHAAGELAHRLHLMGLAQLSLDLLVFGYVALDRADADGSVAVNEYRKLRHDERMLGSVGKPNWSLLRL